MAQWNEVQFVFESFRKHFRIRFFSIFLFLFVIFVFFETLSFLLFQHVSTIYQLFIFIIIFRVFGYWIAAYIVHNFWMIFSFLSLFNLCVLSYFLQSETILSTILLTKFHWLYLFFLFFCILVLILESAKLSIEKEGNKTN